MRRHALVERYYKEYPDPNKLFCVCFGKYPKDKVEVVKRPMALVFICHFYDFAFVMSDAIIKSSFPGLTAKDFEYAEGCFGGAVRMNLPNRELDNIPIVFKKSACDSLDGHLEHEEQHHLNTLFSPNNPQRSSLADVVKRTLQSSSDANDMVRRLIRHIKYSDGPYRSAWDEILAQWRDGSDKATIENFLTGLYLDDFFNREGRGSTSPRKVSWSARSEYGAQLQSLLLRGDFDDDLGALNIAHPREFLAEAIRGEIDEIFYAEWRREARSWMYALTVLEDKGYSREEVTWLLYTEPIVHWNKFARRMPARAKTGERAQVASV